MQKVTFLDMGYESQPIRQTRWYINFHRNDFLSKGYDIKYYNIFWVDALMDNEPYQKIKKEFKPSDVLICRIRYPSVTLDEMIKEDVGENRHSPGAKFTKAFSERLDEMVDALEDDFFGNLTFVNEPEFVECARSKMSMSETFKRAGIPHPQTMDVNSFEELLKCLEEYNSIFGKPVGGTYGRCAFHLWREGDIYRLAARWNIDEEITPSEETHHYARSEESLRPVMEKILQLSSIIQPCLNPPPLKDSDSRDLRWDVRVLEVFGLPVTEIVRTIPYDDIVTNINAGGESNGISILEEQELFDVDLESMRELAEKAATTIGLEECGVDIMWDHDLEPNVLEVNASPGYMSGHETGINPVPYVVSGALKKAGYEEIFPDKERYISSRICI